MRLPISRTLISLGLLAIMPLVAQAQPRGTASSEEIRVLLSAAEGHHRVQLIVDLMRLEQAVQSAEMQVFGREALSILRRQPSAELEADVLALIGATFFHQGERDSTLAYAEGARDLALEAAERRERGRVDVSRLLDRAAESERLIGHVYHERGQYEAAEMAYRSARDRFDRIGNRARAAAVTNDLAVLYKTQGKYLEALAHHTWALAVVDELGMTREVADARHGLGVVYTLMGRYGEALAAFHQVLEQREREEDRESIALTLSNIGGVYEYLEDYEQALEHYQRAHEIFVDLNRKRRIATSLVNIANAHFHLNRTQDAEEAYQRARPLAIETENTRLIAYIDEGMGRLFEREANVAEARRAYRAALAGFEQLGDRRGIATALISLGGLQRDRESVALVQRALSIAEEMRSHQLLRDGYALLSELREQEGAYGDALAAYKQYKAAYDSLFNQESQTTIARLETEYEMREQEQRIALLEQRRQVQRLWMVGLLAGVGLLGVITALSFNRVRLRQRTLAALEQAHRAESEQARLLAEAAEARARFLQAENERKARELEAARRMQLSMLPRDLPRHPNVGIATFMRTAAEVGGDFYDFDLAEDGTLTIAIGDATGHGTQAGTMVAAVKSLFSDYAQAADLAGTLTRSARALRRMALPNVYMAFALARLKGRALEMAGAGMPPAMIYRMRTGNVESVSLRGLPLGAPSDYPYKVEQVRLDPGDTVVLMSDGFPELRNPAGQEFGYDAMVGLVRELATQETAAIQDYLDAAIREWCGDQPVGDDVTFVVMKMKEAEEPVGSAPEPWDGGIEANALVDGA